MEYNEIYKIVKDSPCHKFTVVGSDGRKKTHRLFISTDGFLCQFRRQSRRKGYMLPTETYKSWLSVFPCLRQHDDVKTFRRNVEKVIGYLENSGLWPRILEAVKPLRNVDTEWIERFPKADYDTMRNMLESACGNQVSPDMALSLYKKRGIKTVNWGKFQSWERARWHEALQTKQKYQTRWQLGYDNSIEYDPENNRAWYSEEYRGCANGYYWLMLDEKHVGFCEKD